MQTGRSTGLSGLKGEAEKEGDVCYEKQMGMNLNITAQKKRTWPVHRRLCACVYLGQVRLILMY